MPPSSSSSQSASSLPSSAHSSSRECSPPRSTQVFELEDTRAAFERVAARGKRGKVVLEVEAPRTNAGVHSIFSARPGVTKAAPYRTADSSALRPRGPGAVGVAVGRRLALVQGTAAGAGAGAVVRIDRHADAGTQRGETGGGAPQGALDARDELLSPPSPAVSGASTKNSSPPMRATVSCSRTVACSAAATSTSTSSPAAWP